jgi:tripartite-type tricarboxylate transporter receptor subunit TctC
VRQPRRTLLGGLAATLAAPGLLRAQSFPSRPIRLVVPFGPGATADIIARLVAKAAGDFLGQPFIVENRPGGGGVIGAEAVAKAAPDGYTVCLGTVASHAISAAMVDRLPYDLLRDFQPLTVLVDAPNIIVVHAGLPVQDLVGYLDYARQQGRSTFISGGLGTTSQLVGEVLRVRHHAPLEHVPYRAFGPALGDFLSGKIDMLSYQIPALVQHIQSGAVKRLAAATRQRISLMPDLPTVAELLGDADFDFSAWFGSFLPAGTPRAIVQRLDQAMQAALASPELRDALPAQGLQPVGMGPDAFEPFFQAEVPRWREIVRVTGVRS